MSINSSLPIVFVQELGPAARLAHEAAVRPEFAQAVAQQVSDAQLRQEAKQIQKASESEPGTVVSEEGKEGGAGGYSGQQKPSRQPEKESESSPSAEGPFLGNLVNRKV